MTAAQPQDPWPCFPLASLHKNMLPSGGDTWWYADRYPEAVKKVTVLKSKELEKWKVYSLQDPQEQSNIPWTFISRNFTQVIDASLRCCIEHYLVFRLCSGHGQITNEENNKGKGVALSCLLCLALSYLALGAGSSPSENIPSLAVPNLHSQSICIIDIICGFIGRSH